MFKSISSIIELLKHTQIETLGVCNDENVKDLLKFNQLTHLKWLSITDYSTKQESLKAELLKHMNFIVDKLTDAVASYMHSLKTTLRKAQQIGLNYDIQFRVSGCIIKAHKQ